VRTSLPQARRCVAAQGSMTSLTMGVITKDSAPPKEDLIQQANATSVGQRLQELEELWAKGEGPAHTDCKLRLFGKKEEEVRVTLYRDTAAWCPYCQKVWLQLEEKQIPYRVYKVNMRSYGDKPQEFLQKVPSGLLPAIEVDGQLVTESLVIMQLLESNFDGPKMCPDPGSPQFKEANELLRLERQLFGDWCSLVFRPSGGLGFGGLTIGGDSSKAAFEKTMDRVEAALANHPESPWFLGGDIPSIVDLQYISHVERMLASCLYWKGMQLRGTERWPRLEKWIDSFEQRPSYQATKSDYFTHVRDIPPQYGPGYADNGEEVEAATRAIGGQEGSWQLPLELRSPGALEPLSPHMDQGDEAARQEAACKLLRNLDAVVRFCCRGAGSPGAKQFTAPLADPYAKPNMDWAPEVDVMLRHVAAALLAGDALEPARQDMLANDVQGGADSQQLVKCLAYLRERVGVPRDMSFPAAMQLRAHLNWAIAAVESA